MVGMILLILLPIVCLAGPITLEENVLLQRVCGRTFESSVGKSVNTENATRFEAPFAVSIRTNSTENENFLQSSGGRCSGTLISPRHVITAAHCVLKECIDTPRYTGGCVKNQFVVMSTSCLPNKDGKVICDFNHSSRVKRAFMSKIYHNSKKAFGDVAVYELEHDFPFGKTIWPACLNTIDRPAGSPLVLFGYGYNNDYLHTGSGILRRHPTKIVSHAECSKFSEGDWIRGVDVICTRHPRGFACGGDSGSGQIFMQNGRAFITGALSYGMRCHQDIKPEDIMDFSASTIFHNRWICAATGVCPHRIPTEDEMEMLAKEYWVIER